METKEEVMNNKATEVAPNDKTMEEVSKDNTRENKELNASIAAAAEKSNKEK